MVKGVSAKFKSYEDTIPRFLSFIKFDQAIKGHSSIVLKPSLSPTSTTSPQFVEQVLKFCLQHKDPEAKVFIAEGADGEDTLDVFEARGYKQIAESYNVSLIDLNTVEVDEVHNAEFLRHESIFYPKILRESYLISLPRLSADQEIEMHGSLSTMIGTFPAEHYRGFFSNKKSKLTKFPLKYSIHDIIKCKLPDVSIIDASEYGSILVGKDSLELDKQASSLIGKDWKSIPYLKLIDESMAQSALAAQAKAAAKAEKQAPVA